MAKSLGMQVVSEGVETNSQLKFLLDEGCELAQGFFFSKPLPLDAIQEMLNRPEAYGLPQRRR
jgi:EAL domain-containing protein (putative c-di-GMP-specific phosphodiesterase class I)